MSDRRRAECGLESTVSNTELSEFFGLTEFRGANSVTSFQPIISVPSELTKFLAELTELAAELSELNSVLSSETVLSNSIPPVHQLSLGWYLVLVGVLIVSF